MTSNREKPDQLIEYAADTGAEHPTPEQLLFRMAVANTLNREQRIIWEYHNFDNLTTVEIAKKLNVSQQNISKRIQVIERKLTSWCRANLEVYKALKGAIENADNG